MDLTSSARLLPFRIMRVASVDAPLGLSVKVEVVMREPGEPK